MNSFATFDHFYRSVSTEMGNGGAGQGLRQNSLLTALPAEVLNRLIFGLRLTHLDQGQVLLARGQPIRTVYFPNTAIVSLSNGTQSGASAELLLVGHEGMVGTAAFMGGESSSGAVVQGPGTAYQIAASTLLKEFDRHGEFLELVLRYVQTVIAQTAQSAVCNRLHSIDQQLCRWLLLFLDRAPSNQVQLTHELIAHMLGVRREGVSAAASKLQKRGVIEYSRGRINVLNRDALESRSCECYEMAVSESDRVLPEGRSGGSVHSDLCEARQTHRQGSRA